MSINFSKICFVDFETTGVDPNTCQPVSIGAVMIDPRKLTICDNGVFYAECKFIEDVDEYCLGEIQDDAFLVSGLNKQDILTKPSLKVTWNNFVNWVNFFNPKKDEWVAPILSAFNLPYEETIIRRIMNGHHGGNKILVDKLPTVKDTANMTGKQFRSSLKFAKEPWRFGPKWVFNKSKRIDLAQTCFEWFESFSEPKGASLDAIKGHLGFSSEGAHNALMDALISAEIWCRFMSIQRKVSVQTDFETGGTTIFPISDIFSDFSVTKSS